VRGPAPQGPCPWGLLSLRDRLVATVERCVTDSPCSPWPVVRQASDQLVGLVARLAVHRRCPEQRHQNSPKGGATMCQMIPASRKRKFHFAPRSYGIIRCPD